MQLYIYKWVNKSMEFILYLIGYVGEPNVAINLSVRWPFNVIWWSNGISGLQKIKKNDELKQTFFSMLTFSKISFRNH